MRIMPRAVTLAHDKAEKATSGGVGLPWLLPKLALRPAMRLYRRYRNRHCRDFILRKFPKRSVGVEIGVWEGGLSQEILRVVKPRKLYLVDPWKYADQPEFARAWYGGARESQESMDARHLRVVNRFAKCPAVEILRGNSCDVLPRLPDSSLDWAFIDGDHRYDAVLKDLQLVHQKIKRESLVVCDDYVKEGKWWGDGVKRAVKDSISAGLYEMVLVRENQVFLRALS